MQRHYKFIGLALTGWLLSLSAGLAAAPAVSNVAVTQPRHTKLFDITYDVSSGVSPLAVSLLITTNDISGTNYDFTRYVMPGTTTTNLITNFTGTGYGTAVTPGTNKTITWNAGVSLGDSFKPTPVRFHVAANDQVSPTGFALIPAGSFTMGDSNAATVYSTPVHPVYVSAFYMDVTEVTASLWSNVYQWATNNGYSFTNAGSGKGTNYPIQTVNWYDCLKWCNARTEMELGTGAMSACYYTNITFSLANVYRTGETNISTNCVNWSTNGYRLATEAEWEKAARGGVESNRFPWGQDACTITHSRASYMSLTNYWYDVSPTRSYHPVYGNATAPVGSFSTNGYGLYDMAGNVFELCWDYYSSGQYYDASATNNPHGGPNTYAVRVDRGGDYHYQAYFCMNAQRYNVNPTNTYNYMGFRCVHIP